MKPSVVQPVASAPSKPAPATLKVASDGTPPASPAAAPAPSSAPPPESEADSKPIRAAIMKQIEARFGEVRACYDTHAERSPHGGRASIRFVVAPSGEVVSLADDGSTLEDKSIVACIGKVISSTKFATWNGKAVTLVLPMDFEPNHF